MKKHSPYWVIRAVTDKGIVSELPLTFETAEKANSVAEVAFRLMPNDVTLMTIKRTQVDFENADEYDKSDLRGRFGPFEELPTIVV